MLHTSLVTISKNLIYRFREKFKSTDFVSKNALFTFGITKKSNEPILRKTHHRQTDRQMMNRHTELNP